MYHTAMDLMDIHYKVLAGLNYRLPDKDLWRSYVLGMREEVSQHPRWTMRHHWLINPPPHERHLIPSQPYCPEKEDILGG